MHETREPPGWPPAAPAVPNGLVALAVTAAAVASRATVCAGLATAALCWALHSGFVLGRRGELVFTAASGHAAVILAAAVNTRRVEAV